MSKTDTAKKPVVKDWHPADIKAALEKLGWSLRQLSTEHDLCPGALKIALQKPYPKAEAIIGRTLGMHPDQIWPSRYKHGMANRGWRPRADVRAILEDISTPRTRNIQGRKAL